MVCRDLGMGLPALTVSGAFFGPSSGPVHYDTVACEGSEARLESCVRTPGSGASRCTHAQDVSVACDAAGKRVWLALACLSSADARVLQAANCTPHVWVVCPRQRPSRDTQLLPNGSLQSPPVMPVQ